MKKHAEALKLEGVEAVEEKLREGDGFCAVEGFGVEDGGGDLEFLGKGALCVAKDGVQAFL